MKNSVSDISIRPFILPIYVPMGLMAIGIGMIMLVIPLLAVELTGSYGRASLIFAMVGVGTVIADVPSGFLISRIGIKPAIILGITMLSLASLVAGLLGSAMVLGITGFFMGAGRGMVLLSRMTYIAESTTGQRGRAMATVGGMARIGMMSGPILGGFLAKLLGYGTTLVIAGLIIGSTAYFVVYLSPTVGQISSKQHRNPFTSFTTIVVRYRSVFLTAGLAIVGLQFLRAARIVIVPFWGNSIGLDVAEIGLISGIAMGLELTMFYPVGIIMDRYGRKWTSVPCMVIFATSFVLIFLSHDFWSLLLVVLLAGVGNGLGSGIFLTLGADFSPNEGRSDFLGVWRLVGDLGQTAAPFFVGILTALFTLTLASLVTAAIGYFGALMMLFFVKESK